MKKKYTSHLIIFPQIFVLSSLGSPQQKITMTGQEVVASSTRGFKVFRNIKEDSECYTVAKNYGSTCELFPCRFLPIYLFL
jgi:hypothetical protein